MGAAVAAMAAALLPATVNAVTLSVAPASTAVRQGELFTVSLTIDGLGDASGPALGAFDLDLYFDDGLLDLALVEWGSSLGDGVSYPLTAPTTGEGVNLAWFSMLLPDDLIAAQPGAFELAKLHFKGAAPGTSALNLSVNDLGNESGNTIADYALANGLVGVTASAVPEGGVGWVALVPIGVMLASQRRRVCRSVV